MGILPPCASPWGICFCFAGMCPVSQLPLASDQCLLFVLLQGAPKSHLSAVEIPLPQDGITMNHRRDQVSQDVTESLIFSGLHSLAFPHS